MRSLQSTIRALREHGQLLSEPLDGNIVEPPSGGSWPQGLPSSPLLREFYAECDGGTLGPFSFLPLGEVADETATIGDWMEQTGADEEMPPRGRWLVFGSGEYGHALIWDADHDAVLLYDSDSGSIEGAGDQALADGGPGSTHSLTLARFFERLVNPPINSEYESMMTWIEVLGHLDRLG